MQVSFLQRGGIWVVGQGLLLIAVVGLSVAFPRGLNRLAGIILGVVLLAAGAVFGIAGAMALGRNLTPFPKPLPHARLVRHGIYARVRHPLYTSVMLASVGWALLWQSWPALLAALLLTPFFEAKARLEERWLRARFTEYADYATRTRRFVPFRIGARGRRR